jgi:hypothetical protein
MESRRLAALNRVWARFTHHSEAAHRCGQAECGEGGEESHALQDTRSYKKHPRTAHFSRRQACVERAGCWWLPA